MYGFKDCAARFARVVFLGQPDPSEIAVTACLREISDVALSGPGRALREIYNGVLREPVPEELTALLDRIIDNPGGDHAHHRRDRRPAS